ncbi:MAG: lysine--tRNA ligase, partial [Leucobacter sp.]|nr:lysine--tRNA ligase [Leucobacter sp.]
MSEQQHSTSEAANAAEALEAEVFEQKRVRLEKRARLNELAGDDLGGGAYPVVLPVTATIPEIRAKWAHLEETPDSTSGENVGVAGRVVFQRNTGKLCFAALQAGDGTRIQAMISLAGVGEDSLAAYKELVDLGDHLFVSGEVVSSRRGELSIMVSDWRIAAKALAPLPNMYAELNEETRVRQRYLDLIQR